MTQFQLVWLRNDLRQLDNSLLTAAQQTGLPVVAVFLATATTWSQHHMAPIKQDLLRRRVLALQSELAAIGVPLLAFEAGTYADCAQIIQALAAQGAAQVYWQQEYELRERTRDEQVRAALAQIGISVINHDTQCVMVPGTVLSKTGETYKVFTPFKKTWLAKFQAKGVFCDGKLSVQTAPVLETAIAPVMQLPDGSSKAYPVAELQVLERLREFCKSKVQDYQLQRDFPAIEGTSSLSAYLAIGVISAKQAVARLQLEAQQQLFQEGSGASVWLSELIWREFYKHILVAFPNLIKHYPFQMDTVDLAWGNNQRWFEAWCQGNTGYPIVDAAMRQLNQTGWMHNRLRMIVASFLVKDLQIDWRWGEQYFMSKLIDGDFAANNGGWQWAASTGTDAAPYFRIFNPVTQSERFDSEGRFIRQYLPELASIPRKHIHWPHPLPMSVQYAKPIVDHAKARDLTLAMFKAVKGKSEVTKAKSDDC
jgi:deoxyribodipyrimidine photo-lyase